MAKVGRPTEYDNDLLIAARSYLDCVPDGEIIPTLEGLALYLHIGRHTIYDWISQEGKEEFSHIVEDILSKQARELINHGLKGTYNPTIAKLIMSKHGYTEKTETDITTAGEKINNFNESQIERIARDYLLRNSERKGTSDTILDSDK